MVDNISSQSEAKYLALPKASVTTTWCECMINLEEMATFSTVYYSRPNGISGEVPRSASTVLCIDRPNLCVCCLVVELDWSRKIVRSTTVETLGE